ncbi:MAG TPA: hypothetical protein VJI97_04315 [Candidatus Nanoarchaeia archaeon]|nr:hypothetical protein [Candidatus Nanoarchaeia archaeon]
MIEFNPDGSIKIPDFMQKRIQENQDKFSNNPCILIKKEVVNFTAPKKCVLHMKISDKIHSSEFVDAAFRQIREASSVPLKINKLNEKEFEIEVGTHFKRCSDCTNLIRKYKEIMHGNLIEEKGNCTYSGFASNSFFYEDHFE